MRFLSVSLVFSRSICWIKAGRFTTAIWLRTTALLNCRGETKGPPEGLAFGSGAGIADDRMGAVRGDNLRSVRNVAGFGLHADFRQLLADITLAVGMVMDHICRPYPGNLRRVELPGGLDSNGGFLDGLRLGFPVPLGLAVGRLLSLAPRAGAVHMDH